MTYIIAGIAFVGFVSWYVGYAFGHGLKQAYNVVIHELTTNQSYPVAVCTPARIATTARYQRLEPVATDDTFASLMIEARARNAENERRGFMALPVMELEDCDFGLN